jgi:hypothetical protein
MAEIERKSAKVLLITPELDVLLLSSLDPGNPGRPRYWFAVCGGVEGAKRSKRLQYARCTRRQASTSPTLARRL